MRGRMGEYESRRVDDGYSETARPQDRMTTRQIIYCEKCNNKSYLS